MKLMTKNRWVWCDDSKKLPDEGRRCLVVSEAVGFGKMIWCAYRKGATWMQHAGFYGLGELQLHVVGNITRWMEIPHEATDDQIKAVIDEWWDDVENN